MGLFFCFISAYANIFIGAMMLHIVSRQRNLSCEILPCSGDLLLGQWRFMTTSKRVQDRSKRKRVHNLEIVVEKHKIISKVLALLEILKQEPEQVMPVRSLDRYRSQINLPKPHKISVFLRKSPKLFELYKDSRGILWCGMTKMAEMLLEEESVIIEQNSDKVVEYVTRMLMMSVDKLLPLDKIAHFRRDMGLPIDFRSNWVHKYPENFRVVQPFKPHDEGEYLELVAWKPSWSITELEKKASVVNEELDNVNHEPGMLSLAFPMKFPPNYRHVCRYRGKIENFQQREYLSPYADAKELKAGTLEFDKRAIAVMHELLSFTIGKRLVTDHLTHFRREFVMPQKLMRLLLKHFGIFYVSEKGKRFVVFLKEAYEGPELIVKHPLVIWREKVDSLIGHRKKKKSIEGEDQAEMEDEDLSVSGSEGESQSESEQENESMEILHDVPSQSSSDIKVEEIHRAYNN